MFKSVIALFILGLSFGSGPCLASCGPILLAYTAGTKKGFLKSCIAYCLFSLSRISVYVFLSILIFILGKWTAEKIFGKYSAYLVVLGGAYIVLVGFLMILGKANKIGKRLLERDKKSIIIMGFVIGLLPCAPLLAILSYIGLVSLSGFQSLLYSAIFGLGTFFSPLILLAAFSGAISKFFSQKKQFYNRLFSIICGLVIIIFGVHLITYRL